MRTKSPAINTDAFLSAELTLLSGGATVRPPTARAKAAASDYKDVKTDLAPGDVVVFSSDGIVEAPARVALAHAIYLPPPGSAGELFGFERLHQSAAHWAVHSNTAEAVAAGIWSDITAWCGKESHHDDMTLLVLRVTG